MREYSETEIKRLLADVLIRHKEAHGYAHDIAAELIASEDELSYRFHIQADERGFGPLNWKVSYKSVLDALEELAQMGGEMLRFHSYGGIEFQPNPDLVDWASQIKSITGQ